MMTRLTLLCSACLLPFLLASCSEDRVTVDDLMRAQGTVAFMVGLPDDLAEEDRVLLQLVGEDGPVSHWELGTALEPGEVIKVFILRDSGEYRFSMVSEKIASGPNEMDLGEATLRAWQGDISEQVFEVDQGLAVFSVDGTSSLPHPSGDDLVLRVTVRKETSAD